MLVLPAAYAQTDVEATITSTNFDVKTKSIYAEMNYTPRSCGNYQIRFYLKTKRSGEQDPNQKTKTAISLDTAYSNIHGSRKISTYTDGNPSSPYSYKVLNLDRTSVGGYFLRFSLDAAHEDISSEDSAEICLQVFRTAYNCVACGVNYTDRAFTPNDVSADCPYQDDNPNNNDDLVACEKSGDQKNWWAWVQDPRDCNVYKVVKMPDGRWWFAQNLNYQQYINYNPGARQDASMPNMNKPIYFCPGPQGAGQNINPYYETGDNDRVKWGCHIYGALYPWKTIMALDGDGPDSAPQPVTHMATSKIRGVCPPGWYVPNDYDWGVMLNYAEGTPCAGKETAPSDNRTPPSNNCNHLTRIVNTVEPYSLIVTGTTDDDGGNSPAAVALNGMASVTGNDSVFFYRLGARASRALKANLNCGGPVLCDNDNTNNASYRWGLYTNGTGSTKFAYTRWAYSTNQGVDDFGFSVLPAGFRHSMGGGANGYFFGRGAYAIFASATAADNAGSIPVLRMFTYNEATVTRFFATRPNSLYSAFSVRCIK
jgi:uncharacterized protein (TIGR02145 family)